MGGLRRFSEVYGNFLSETLCWFKRSGDTKREPGLTSENLPKTRLNRVKPSLTWLNPDKPSKLEPKNQVNHVFAFV